MAAEEPSYKEDAEDDVACHAATKIVETFSQLYLMLVMHGLNEGGYTYWEENVPNVHDAKDNISDFDLVETI